jgi:ribosome-associated translation inhibitor RaiA
VRIQITGRHVGVTEAMKDYAREKVGNWSGCTAA